MARPEQHIGSHNKTPSPGRRRAFDGSSACGNCLPPRCLMMWDNATTASSKFSHDFLVTANGRDVDRAFRLYTPRDNTHPRPFAPACYRPTVCARAQQHVRYLLFNFTSFRNATCSLLGDCVAFSPHLRMIQVQHCNSTGNRRGHHVGRVVPPADAHFHYAHVHFLLHEAQQSNLVNSVLSRQGCTELTRNFPQNDGAFQKQRKRGKTCSAAIANVLKVSFAPSRNTHAYKCCPNAHSPLHQNRFCFIHRTYEHNVLSDTALIVKT